ncbi:MAG: hypothetical protein RL701_575 [Pseudomonadota bacterium]
MRASTAKPSRAKCPLQRNFRLSHAARAAMLMVACATALWACGDDDDDATGQGGRSGAAAGTGAGGSGGSGLAAPLGAACTTDAECGSASFCAKEIRGAQPLPGSPDSGRLEIILFPGGACTPTRLGPYDPDNGSCDPLMPRGVQGCGSDGVCAVVSELQPAANGAPQVTCRNACEPSATETGCTRDGYTCSFGGHACIEGCLSNVECRLKAGPDTDGDSEADSEYDAQSTAICSQSTLRCSHEAGKQASGQSCTRDDECAKDGICLTEFSTLAGQEFPSGYCSRLGCAVDGVGCDGDAVCEPVRPWFSEGATADLCLQRCTVGAERESDRLGVKGHGEGCREGYRCHYNGGQGASAGVCVGGDYNAVTTNNVGATCSKDTECFSPYGLGHCSLYALQPATTTATAPAPAVGICTIMDCAAPGIPSTVCGPGNECAATGDDDNTMCFHQCKAATECATGFACTDDDRIPSTPKVCYPVCAEKADCRSGEVCTPLSNTSVAGVCRLQ